MKFARFHLSTLLLLCVFCGACVGVWLAPAVWQRHFDVALPEPGLWMGINHVSALAFNAAGTRLFAQDCERRQLIDLDTRKVVWVVRNVPLKLARFARFDEGEDIIQSVPINVNDEEELRLDCYSVKDGKSIKELKVPMDIDTQFIRPRVGGSFGREWALPDSAEATKIRIGVDSPETLICELELGKRIAAIKFAFDGNYLAAGYDGGVSIWRRTRGYGWTGYLELPLLWVAAASFFCLVAIFIRWLLRLRSKRA